LNPPRIGKRHLIAYPHLFLSYSRANIQVMQTIRSQLQYEGFETWSDERLEPGTPEWHTAIETAIEKSGGFIVLMTPDAKASTWVNREIECALKYYKRIFQVLVDGDEDSAVPRKLGNVQRVDLRTDIHSGTRSLGNAIRKYLYSQTPTAAEAMK